MPNISLVMIVKDESGTLKCACFESVKDHVNKIVIVDTGSTDHTIELAKTHGAAVYEYTRTNDFAAARNFALSKSTSENLILDADEQITSWDKGKVNILIQTDHFIGKINNKSNFKQNNEERYSQIFISRLLLKGAYYAGKIHEQVMSKLPWIE